MGFVDEEREGALAVLIADLIENDRELLHRGNDDFLAGLKELAQVAGVFGMADRGRDLWQSQRFHENGWA
jgi:hypothetical protein